MKEKMESDAMSLWKPVNKLFRFIFMKYFQYYILKYLNNAECENVISSSNNSISNFQKIIEYVSLKHFKYCY